MKYNYKRPMMFYQPTASDIEYNVRMKPQRLLGRIRIFYPNGRTEWIDLHNDNTESRICCFIMGNIVLDSERAILLANRYDKDWDFPEMEFLGYL